MHAAQSGAETGSLLLRSIEVARHGVSGNAIQEGNFFVRCDAVQDRLCGRFVFNGVRARSYLLRDHVLESAHQIESESSARLVGEDPGLEEQHRRCCGAPVTGTPPRLENRRDGGLEPVVDARRVTGS